MPPLERWQAFNAELAVLTQSKNTARSPLNVVDHFSGFDEASDLINDRVHPNAAGEEKIAQRWFEAINFILVVKLIFFSDFISTLSFLHRTEKLESYMRHSSFSRDTAPRCHASGGAPAPSLKRYQHAVRGSAEKPVIARGRC